MPDSVLKLDRATRFPAFVGMVLILLGATVIAGWMLKISALVRIQPDWAAMVFNTALCFMLLGVALALSGIAPIWRERVQVLLGSLTVVIAALTLSQDLFSIELGIDHLFSADWLRDTRPHPTRMAPNTATAFMLGGVTLIALNRGRAPWVGHAAQYLALAVELIGLTALLGYLLKLEFLFAWYPYARMAAHTATGFTLLGFGLWARWRCANRWTAQTSAPDTRIVFTGSIILIVMALTAGIGGFLALGQQTEATLKRNLQVSLHNRIEVYRDALDSAVVNVRDIAARLAIQRELQRWHASPGHPEALDFLRRAISSYTRLGMNAVALDDASGRRVVLAGAFVRAPALRVPLQSPPQTELLWGAGLIIHARVPIVADKQFLGTVTAEQPLPLLTQMFDNVRGLGETGEMVLCATRGDGIICFPTRLRPEVFTVPPVVQGSRLPIARSLDGFDDVALAVDYRGKQVIAAYSPVARTGLGMVIKMSVDEIYAPIHRQFQQILLLLLALSVGGILLLRWRVLPLAHRLVRSEQETRAAYRQLQESEQRWQFALEGARDGVWDWNLQTNEVFFSRQWKSMLGYEEHEISEKLEEWDKRVHPEDKARAYADIEKHLTGQAPYYENEHRVRCKDGSYKWILDRGMIVSRDVAGKPLRMIGTHTDITARKRAEETIREMSLVDDLTGLRNRRGLLTLAEIEIPLARRMKRGMALFYADLDGMKHINDTFGHAAGDQALRDVADVLRKTFRESDIVARLGGDEFAVLALETVQQPTTLILQRLQDNITQHNQTAGRNYQLSLSVGAVHIGPTASESLDALLAQADQEMYRIKQARRTVRRN